MTSEQIQILLNPSNLPYETKKVKLIETHISWVILTDHYVYKIKKPVFFSFLDFSSIQKRKLNCEQEVALNKRLANDMYLDVLPVLQFNDQVSIGSSAGNIIDYAVLMKRMDEQKQLDLLIEKNKVMPESMKALADVLAVFHNQAIIIPEGEDWEELHEEYADILSVNSFIHENFSSYYTTLIKNSCDWVYQFFERNNGRIDQRNQKGFVIDGHGDLHTRNIFMSNPPVVFDCIEFSDDFRKLDILSEIAFLCMDLERFGKYDLSQAFLDYYLPQVHCIENDIDQQIFLYYKLYRANVMIKVHSLRAQNLSKEESAYSNEMDLIQKYLELFNSYAGSLGITTA